MIFLKNPQVSFDKKRNLVLIRHPWLIPGAPPPLSHIIKASVQEKFTQLTPSPGTSYVVVLKLKNNDCIQLSATTCEAKYLATDMVEQINKFLRH